MPNKYYEDDTLNRKCLNYLRSLRRRATSKPDVVRCQAHGGPYDGKPVFVTAMGDGKTATFQVGDWHGRYESSSPGAVVWVPVS